MVTIPTVLVGLGGIGSEIVDRVYGMVPEEERDHVAVHGFDTDVNSLGKWNHLSGSLTQISAPITVGQCYEIVSDSGGTVKQWFPPLTTELERKPITEGAGQIRAISRLAYYYTMITGGLNAFEEQLGKIFKEKGSKFETTPRIIIVSSLAGGTGAGIFLQTALYLREILEKYYGQNTTLVRGMFILPDILIKCNVLKSTEHDNVRANAYACLKELDAITKIAGGENHGATIELEYRPSQLDAAGRQTHAIVRGQKPYDLCFLYDYENSRGHHLGELSHYKEQVVQSLFLQFFSPVGEDNRSQEDNNIRESNRYRGANCYCGSGVARLIYPYNDLIDYCGLRWLNESLDKEWLWLDKDFSDEIKNYERDINNSVSRERPLRGKRYVELLDSLGTGDASHPFFKRMYLSTRIIDEKGRPQSVKTAIFLEAVKRKAEALLKSKQDYQEALAVCSLDEGNLKNKEKALNEVTSMEDNLESLKETVFSVVHELKSQILNDVVGRDCSVENCLTGTEPYQLNSWFLRSGSVSHPIATRYMFYKLELELEDKINSLTAQNQGREDRIKKYGNHENDADDTEYDFLPAEDKVRLALDAKLFRKKHPKLREFAKDYLNKSEEQKKILARFVESKLLEDVYSRILEAVRVLISKWENLFDGLGSEQARLREEIDREEKKHQERTDPSIIFLLAGLQEKRELWEKIKSRYVNDSRLPDDICTTLYKGIFKRFCCDFFPSSGREFSEINFGFHDAIFDWCRSSLKLDIDINKNVMRALKDSEKHGNKTIEQLHRLAQPFIALPSDWREDEEASYWGINPASAETLSEDERLQFFGGTNALISQDAFSSFELVRYRAVYGIKASDLPKFKGSYDASVTGDYFKSYIKGVEELKTSPDFAITHHLDSKWHVHAFMPDLNPELAQSDEEKINRAFLLGLMLKTLQYGKSDNRTVWEISTSSGVSTVQVKGSNIGTDFFDLYKAMSYNPIVVGKILDDIDIQCEHDKKQYTDDIDKHLLVKGVKEEFRFKSDNRDNMLDVIFSLALEKPGDDLLDITLVLLECFMKEIEGYYIRILGDHRKNTAKSKSALLIKELRDSSSIYNDSRGGNHEFFSKWDNKITFFIDTLNQSS